MNKPLINYCCYVKGEELHGLIAEDSDIYSFETVTTFH